MFINGKSLGAVAGNYNAGDAFFGLGTGVSGKALNGAVAEVLVYNGMLDYGERNRAGTYLAAKYGLASSYVPATSPEASNPSPADNSYGNPTNVVLSWSCYANGLTGLKFDVYFSTNSSFPEGARISGTTQTNYVPEFSEGSEQVLLASGCGGHKWRGACRQTAFL